MGHSGFLHRYYLENGGKPVDKWIHYFDVYERHFERFRGNRPTVLEIGVFGGGSLAMWKAYFGPGSRIVGLDIEPKCKAHEEEDIEIFIGSQDDPAVLGAILEKYGPPDIVIDDGSHRMEHMTATFDLLYDRISPNGVYLVEDAHTCYWDEFNGGLHREGSFIERAKSLVDSLNACHSRGQMPVNDFTRSTDSIAFYDSVVVFERKPQGVRQESMTGAMKFRT